MAEKTNLTEAEARAFNGYFLTGTVGFIAVAIAAHLLAWAWRPWL